MVYKIIFNNEKIIHKDISKIPKDYIQIIFNKLEELSKNWIWKAQVKKLNNYYLSDYRLRVWDYRILFNLSIDNNKIVIFRILHRSKLY